jgi:hypothetical protein
MRTYGMKVLTAFTRWILGGATDSWYDGTDERWQRQPERPHTAPVGHDANSCGMQSIRGAFNHPEYP